MKKEIYSIAAWLLAFAAPFALLTACDDDDDEEDITENGSTDNSVTGDNSTIDSSTMIIGEAVDLGLSVKWSNINIGAESPADNGNYYSWSKVTDDGGYYVNTTPLYGDFSLSDISGNATYDAATFNWGSSWRMPTKDECQELIDDCTWTWTSQENSDGSIINGYEVEGTNGNVIFLSQSSGYGSGPDMYAKGGAFWTSTASETDSTKAYRIALNPDSIITKYTSYANVERLSDQCKRHCGWPVRPVQK